MISRVWNVTKVNKVGILQVTSIVEQDLKPVKKSHMTGRFASVCRTKSKQEQKKKNTMSWKQGRWVKVFFL